MGGNGLSEVLFCFGLGYTARVLARRLAGRGVEIRGDRSGGRPRRRGRVWLFDRGRPLDRARRGAGRRYPRPDFDRPGRDRRSSARRARSGPPNRPDPALGRLSRHHRGLWRPAGRVGRRGDAAGAHLARADRRARAEAAWQGSGLPVHIFRLAGIYGPGRNAFTNLRDGTARRIVKPGQVFSRIHVEDIATVLEASMADPRPGRTYNVCDDEPAPPQDVVAYAARLLGIEPPPEQAYETAQLSPMARTFYKDNRRVRNARIKEELGVRLAYPAYREACRACSGASAGNQKRMPRSSPPQRMPSSQSEFRNW